MSDGSDFEYFDEEIDETKHDSIVNNVLSLNKVQHLKKPSRTEPTSYISEFNLVNSLSGKVENVELDKLSRVLSKKKHVPAKNRLEATQHKVFTLPKPLEKPLSDRIKRSVGYERNRFLFDRWEAYVTSNRAQAHLKFPLQHAEKLSVISKEVESLPQTWKFKSELEKTLEKIEKPKTEEYVIEDQKDQDFPLTLQEMKEKRKEAAKLRAHQSFKEAKACRQNKIKSKKYHRILRKEKIKEKLKEFEELQKTNPEAALAKLGEIEKARVLERFSLRHKGTGQWAKSKQVRAKYDKESRAVLAQQLKISRDLTQKVHESSESEEEPEKSSETSVKTDGDNPWTNGLKPDKDVSEFVNGYRKFWTSENVSKKTDNKENAQQEEIENNEDDTLEEILSNSSKEEIIEAKTNIEEVDKVKIHTKGQELPSKLNNDKSKLKNKKKQKIIENPSKNKKVKTRSNQKQHNVKNSSGQWDVDELFEKLEDKLQKKLLKKKNKLTKTKTGLNKPKKKGKKANKNKVSLDMPSQKVKPIIDEEMQEDTSTINVDNEENQTTIDAFKKILEDIPTNTKAPKQNEHADNIDPSKFMIPKSATQLDSANPDLMIDDNSDDETQKNIIMEAFEDDNIVQDFSNDKKNELNKDSAETIDLNLPGWGSWAGAGINPKKQRKRRRFIIKLPTVGRRKDQNKGSLIINEDAAIKARAHQVSEIPFPFKSMKDYEASIRAPIGNSFVPELAFRKNIKPAVETKMGTIIEPVTTGILMGKPKKR